MRAKAVAEDKIGIWRGHSDQELIFCKKVLLEIAERCTIFLDEYGYRYDRKYEEPKL